MADAGLFEENFALADAAVDSLVAVMAAAGMARDIDCRLDLGNSDLEVETRMAVDTRSAIGDVGTALDTLAETEAENAAAEQIAD